MAFHVLCRKIHLLDGKIGINLDELKKTYFYQIYAYFDNMGYFKNGFLKVHFMKNPYIQEVTQS